MEIQNIRGKQWSARKVDHIYIVSLKNYSNIVEALTDFVQHQNIQAGEVSGIGAVSEATLRFFNFKTKTYADRTFKEQMEVSNISGNVSVINGTSSLHMHITLGRRLHSFSGTSFRSKGSWCRGIYFYPLDTKAVKIKDEETGINFYDFEQ